MINDVNAGSWEWDVRQVYRQVWPWGLLTNYTGSEEEYSGENEYTNLIPFCARMATMLVILTKPRLNIAKNDITQTVFLPDLI